MRNHSKLIVAAIASTMIMAAAASSASANRLSLSSQTYRVVYTSLELTEPFGFFGTVLCPVTLEGTYHSATIAKTVGSLIGYVTRASLTNTGCIGGHATIQTETLPWHVTYQGFSGTLPSITRTKQYLIGATFIVEPAGTGWRCLSRTTTTEPAEGEVTRESGGNVTTLTPNNRTIRLTAAAGGVCGASSGRFSAAAGDGQITVLGSTTKIRLTLI